MSTKHTEAGLKLRGVGNSHLDIKERLKQRCYEKLKETRNNLIKEERMKNYNNSSSSSNIDSGGVLYSNTSNRSINKSNSSSQSPPPSPLKQRIDVKSTVLKEYEMLKLEFDTTTTTTTTTTTPIKSKSPVKLLPIKLPSMTKYEEDLMIKEVQEYIVAAEEEMIKQYEEILRLEQEELQYYSTIADNHTDNVDDFDLQL